MLIRAQNIPYVLIVFRLIAGPAILALCVYRPPMTPELCAILLGLGVISDIFDGVIARRLNCVTPTLRLMDSRCDVVFWLSIAMAVHVLHPALWQITWIMLVVLGAMELMAHLISFIRFRREASPHHIMSKIFCLFLWALLTQMFLIGEAGWLFWLTLGVGIISQAESMAIMLMLPQWQCDVKNFKAALSLKNAAKSVR